MYLSPAWSALLLNLQFSNLPVLCNVTSFVFQVPSTMGNNKNRSIMPCSQCITMSISHCLPPKTQTEAQKYRDLLKISQPYEGACLGFIPWCPDKYGALSLSQLLPLVMQLMPGIWDVGSLLPLALSTALSKAFPSSRKGHPGKRDRLELGCNILQGY